MSVENHLLKQVVNLIWWRIQIGVDFIQDDFLLLGQLVLRESGAKGDVGEKVKAALVMLFEEGGLKAGLFFGSEGVEVAAHVVKTAQDVVGLTVLRAFEDGVFHEMGSSRVPVSTISTKCAISPCFSLCISRMPFGRKASV